MPKQKPQLLDENSLVAIKDYVENKQVVIDDITNIPVYSVSSDGQILTVTFSKGYVLTYLEMELKSDAGMLLYASCTFNPANRTYTRGDCQNCSIDSYTERSKDKGGADNAFDISVDSSVFPNFNLNDFEEPTIEFERVSGTFEFEF